MLLILAPLPLIVRYVIALQGFTRKMRKRIIRRNNLVYWSLNVFKCIQMYSIFMFNKFYWEKYVMLKRESRDVEQILVDFWPRKIKKGFGLSLFNYNLEKLSSDKRQIKLHVLPVCTWKTPKRVLWLHHKCATIEH